MFDYVNQMQRALGSKAKRAAIKSGGAAAILLGTGFLLAALWTWIASELGAIYASLILGGVFTAAGLAIWIFATSVRYPVPGTDELRRQVGEQVDLVADVVAEKLRTRAHDAMNNAQTRFTSLLGASPDRMSDEAEEDPQDLRDSAADLAGQASETIQQARETFERVAASRAGPAIGVAGAFAVGMILAGVLRKRRDPRDDEYYYYDDDY
ncbi:MAG: hypothetical protein ACK5LJ_11965 [Paracoccus sp. (in: a-proteobacteria)]